MVWRRITGPGVHLPGPIDRPSENTAMVDDATLVDLWQRMLRDPRASDPEIRTLCIVALLCNEDFRLRLIEWFLEDKPGSVHQRPILYH